MGARASSSNRGVVSAWGLRIGLTLVVSGLAAPTAARAAGDTTCTFSGDLNGDGLLSSGDAQTAFFIALGMVTPNYREVCAADCNHDGVVSSGDAQQVFMAALGMANCDNGCGPDAFEVDDAAGSAATLLAGVAQSHSFCPEGDEDWFAFTLAGPARVRLETVSGGPEAAQVWLYDEALLELAAGQPGGSGLEQVIEATLAPGNYFARAAADSSGVVANYDVTLSLTPTSETDCTDEVDDDDDGDTDCNDADCAEDPACLVLVMEICGDGLDNEGDGATDCADSDCAHDPFCLPEPHCYDYRDNDYDALTDCDDPDCAADTHCAPPERFCEDRIDNDRDGDVDCADSDCAAADPCPPERACQDGRDNDGDGRSDCDDADCAAVAPCNLPCCELAEGTYWLRGTAEQCAAHGGTAVAASACLPSCCALVVAPETTFYEWRLPGVCAAAGGQPAAAADCAQVCCLGLTSLSGSLEPSGAALMTPEQCALWEEWPYPTPAREKTSCLRAAVCCATPAGHYWTNVADCASAPAAPADCTPVYCGYGDNLYRYEPRGDCPGAWRADPPSEQELHPECFEVPEPGEPTPPHCPPDLVCSDDLDILHCTLPGGYDAYMSAGLCSGACFDYSQTSDWRYADLPVLNGTVCCFLGQGYRMQALYECVASHGRPVDAAHCRNPHVCCFVTDPQSGFFGPAWKLDVHCATEGFVVADDLCTPDTVCCELAEGPTELPEPTCARLGGSSTAAADCEPVCCERFWEHSATSRAACTADGGAAADWSLCGPVCCFDHEPMPLGAFVAVPGDECTAAGLDVVDPQLCEERCCLVQNPAAVGRSEHYSWQLAGNCQGLPALGYGTVVADSQCAEACCEYGQNPTQWTVTTQGECRSILNGYPREGVDCVAVCCEEPDGSFRARLASDCAAMGGQDVGAEALCAPACCQYPAAGDGPVFQIDAAGNCTPARQGTPAAMGDCLAVCCAEGTLQRRATAGRCAAIGGQVVPDDECVACVEDFAACAPGDSCCSPEMGCLDGTCQPCPDQVCCRLAPPDSAPSYAFTSTCDCVAERHGAVVAEAQCDPVCCRDADDRVLRTTAGTCAEIGVPLGDAFCDQICCLYTGETGASYEFLSADACARLDGSPEPAARCEADVVCCAKSEGSLTAYAFAGRDDCLADGGRPTPAPNCGRCCYTPPDVFGVSTSGVCSEGSAAAARQMCGSTCCESAGGTLFQETWLGVCQVVLTGRPVEAAQCARECCRRGDEYAHDTRGNCAAAGGESAPDFLCDPCIAAGDLCLPGNTCCGLHHDCVAGSCQFCTSGACTEVPCCSGFACVAGECQACIAAGQACQSGDLCCGDGMACLNGACQVADTPVCCEFTGGDGPRYETVALANCTPDTNGTPVGEDSCQPMCCEDGAGLVWPTTAGSCAALGEPAAPSLCVAPCCEFECPNGPCFEFLSPSACARVNGQTAPTSQCTYDLVCCTFAMGHRRFETRPDCVGRGGVPSLWVNCGVCCHKPPGAFGIAPGGECGAGWQSVDRRSCTEVCCARADGAFLRAWGGFCNLAPAGEVVESARCDNVCCQSGTEFTQRTRGSCATVDGFVAASDQCAEICCRKGSFSFEYSARGSCSVTGGTPVADADCNEVCCHRGTDYSRLPAAECAAFGGEVVEARLCVR